MVQAQIGVMRRGKDGWGRVPGKTYDRSAVSSVLVVLSELIAPAIRAIEHQILLDNQFHT